MRELDSGSIDYVRELAITMENESGLMEGVVGGELFTSQRFSDLRFCSATAVSLVFRSAGVVNGNSWSAARSGKVMDNVRQFCLFVRQMAPKMRCASVICERQQICEYKMGTDILYTGIMDSLAQVVDSVTFSYENTSHRLARISLEAGFALTHLEYLWNAQTWENVLDIICDCTAHLDSLAIKGIPDCAMVASVFLDEENRPLRYPRLKKLHISTTGSKLADQSPLDHENPRFAAFPALQHLSISGAYPVADDAFFRGNHSSLHTLSLSMDPALTERLFTNTLVPLHSLHKLRTLCLHAPSAQSQVETTKMQGLVGQLLLCMPFRLLQTLELRGGFDYAALADKICGSEGLASIQTLVLDGPRCASPSMRDIIRIIKHLPCLADLHSGISQSGFNNYMDESLLPYFCIKTYSPMPRHFRCWTIVDCTRVPVQTICLTAMILAIICPQFTFAALPLSRMPKYSEVIRQSLCKEPFKTHESSISRLLFTGK
ncbi:hypothetical protein LPJ56_004288 [Coemansia sp. RSA 2599]|nr:hypothetical protein LPJ56_004288 [Coemansia sp. RSA 2599]